MSKNILIQIIKTTTIQLTHSITTITTSRYNNRNHINIRKITINQYIQSNDSTVITLYY